MKSRITTPLLLLASASISLAATVASFDGAPGDTPYTATQNGAAPAAFIGSGNGPDGSDALQITTDTFGGQQNNVAFDRAVVGAPTGAFSFTFDFKMGPEAASADGVSFAFLPTSTYGISGAGPQLTEDPVAAGVLAFGFDTWGNGAPFDGPFGGGGNSDYNDISLFFNGNLIAANLDPRASGLTIDDNLWHTATGVVDMAAGTVSLTIGSLNIFNNVSVPGLTPYEYRVGIGSRTGGEDENAWFDNISIGVPVVPEPATGAMAAMGLCFLARRRRK